MRLSHNIKGYVLLIVLIFLQILSCLGLYELTSTATTVKMNYHRWLKESSFVKAKKVLSDIEHSVLDEGSNCIFPIITTNELSKKSVEWWQLQGCHRFSSNIDYYYIVESLGNDSCAVIKEDVNNQAIIVDYYRITLFVQFDKNYHSKLILQSTLAKRSQEHLSCKGSQHMVVPGRQMIREL